jgi:hypothetical protein
MAVQKRTLFDFCANRGPFSLNAVPPIIAKEKRRTRHRKAPASVEKSNGQPVWIALRALSFPRSYYFAAAAAAIVYFPVQVYSNPPSAVPVVLQVPDPLMPFIFPVPPVI